MFIKDYRLTLIEVKDEFNLKFLNIELSLKSSSMNELLSYFSLIIRGIAELFFS